MKISRIIWYTGALVSPGGEERLLLEGVRFFNRIGIKTYILTWEFNNNVLFNGSYDSVRNSIILLQKEKSSKAPTDNSLLENVKHLLRLFVLRKKIKELKPDVIITQSHLTSISLYLATIFIRIPYVIFIHSTPFRFSPNSSPYFGSLKYAFVYRRYFTEIRNSVVSYRDTTPLKLENFGIWNKVKVEIRGILSYLAVKKAARVFVLSHQNKWVVKKLNNKESVVAKGAFPDNIFDYKPVRDIKDILGLKGKKVILSISRLAPNKRVDLCIKSFALIANDVRDSVLVIGGLGPEERKLKNLVKELSLEHRVKFVGFVKEEELWDYYSSCDIFINLDIASFDIASYTALALGKKLVCTTEFEIDNNLPKRFIFVARPNKYEIAISLKKALYTNIGPLNSGEKALLKEYTWEKYFSNILKEILSM